MVPPSDGDTVVVRVYSVFPPEMESQLNSKNNPKKIPKFSINIDLIVFIGLWVSFVGNLTMFIEIIYYENTKKITLREVYGQ